MSAIRLGCLILSLAWSGVARADAADDSYNPDDSGSGGSGSSGGSSGSSGGSSGSSGGDEGSGGSSGGDEGGSGGDSADKDDDKDCGCASGAASPTSLLSLGAGLLALGVAARRRA